MGHPIEQFHNGDGQSPGILYRESKNFLRASLAAFGGGLLVAAVGAVIINDYAFGWATTCHGDPMPFWPAYIGGALFLAGGWLTLSRGYAISTILDPFATGQVLDARGQTFENVSAKPQKPRTAMDEAAATFDETVARASEGLGGSNNTIADDGVVTDGEWTPVGEIPA